MTTAILSFTIAGRMTFRCDSLRIDERRDLEPDPPFASWAQRYATANASRELLLDLGVEVGCWLDGEQHWLGCRRICAGAAGPPCWAGHAASPIGARSS
jgi:hypothetical protein